MSQKSVFHKTLTETTRKVGQNTVAILMAAPLPYLLITVKEVAFEIVSLSDTQNPKAVC